VAAGQRDAAGAATNYLRAIELAGTDTSYAEIRRRSTFELGRLASDQVDTATGTNKVAKAKEAIRHFTAYLADAPAAPDAPAVRNTLVEMYVAAGDSASVPTIYADLIANPGKYDDIALVQAGVIPTRLNRTADAAKLFAAALEYNPYQRDALSNLAAMYFALNQFKEMIPVVDRLVKADPSNPDNWLLYAFAYQGLQRVEKDPKLKRAYTDSLIKYNKKSEDMPVKVAFSGFTRGEQETSLTGDIENRGTAPKTFAMQVEFLDKAGNVISTETASVGPVAPKETGRFSIKVPKGGIAAFRYAPLT
jgi:predicted Zn-dependent protease